MGAGAISYAADVFSKSGGVGLLTAVVFFVCLGIGLERLLFWIRFWGLRSLVGLRGSGGERKALDRIEGLVRAGRFADAGEVAGRGGRPVLRLTGGALSVLREARAWPGVLQHSLAESLGANATLGRRFLIAAIQGFGLLGMLGTCKGLYAQMSGFGASANQMAGLQAAMGGMGEAFTTTLVGLTAALLTTLIYLPNEMAVERFKRELLRVDSRIRAALTEYVAHQDRAAKAVLGGDHDGPIE